MENFAVDLDKVLDDFEFDEDNPTTGRTCTSVTTSESATNSSYKAEVKPVAPPTTLGLNSPYQKNVYNNRYGLQYDGDKFDMSGADFGPSPPKATFVTTDTTNDHEVQNLTNNVTSNFSNNTHIEGAQYNNVVTQNFDSGQFSATVVTQNSNISKTEPDIRTSYGCDYPKTFQDSFGLPMTTGSLLYSDSSQTQYKVSPIYSGNFIQNQPVSEHFGVENSADQNNVNTDKSEIQREIAESKNDDMQTMSLTTGANLPLESSGLSSQKLCVGQIKVLPCCSNDSPSHSIKEEIVITNSLGENDSVAGAKVELSEENVGEEVQDASVVEEGEVGTQATDSPPKLVSAEQLENPPQAGMVTVVADVNPQIQDDAISVATVPKVTSTGDNLEKTHTVTVSLSDQVEPVSAAAEVSEPVAGVSQNTGFDTGAVVPQSAIPETSGAQQNSVAESEVSTTDFSLEKTPAQDSGEVTAVVGFSENVISADDIDDTEMDSYLNSVEICDISKPDVTAADSVPSSVVLETSSDRATRPETDLNLNTSENDKSNILPSPVVLNFQTQISSDNNEDQPSASLPFLMQAPVMETMSTPAEDPGFSRVPGLAPEPPKVNSESSGATPGPASDSSASSDLSLPQTQMSSMGARPKEASSGKPPRPNSLIGLSRPTLPMSVPDANREIPVGVTISDTSANALHGLDAVQNAMSAMEQPLVNSHDAINQQIADQTKCVMNKKQINVEIKQQIEQERRSPVSPSGSESGGQNNLNLATNTSAGPTLHTNNFDSPMQASGAEGLPSPGSFGAPRMRAARPHSFPAATPPSPPGKHRRPTSLNLPPRTDFTKPQDSSPEAAVSGLPVDVGSASPSRLEEDVLGVTTTTLPPNVGTSNSPVQEGAIASSPGVVVTEPSFPNPQSPAAVVSQLGKVAPVWVPDSDAPNCMQCDAKFTFTRRRHHCRACGKVFCSTCCNLKSKLPYMDNKEARVCQLCHVSLVKGERRPWSVSLGEDSYPSVGVLRQTGATQPRSPNPNNPSEYCSVISPMQQANPHAPPPTVMVPVGVLKREGTQRKGEPKSVMFSDGIRPGGDLTELDGSAEPRPLIRKTGRTAKKVERTPMPTPEGAAETVTKTTQPSSSPPKTRQVRIPDTNRNICLIPETGLPPVILTTGVKGDYSIEEDPDPEQILPKLKSDDVNPIVFAVNKNLFVLVKILNLDCCVNRVCWCFTTKGMCTVGQDEIVIVLECLPDEKTVPRDIFCHLNTVYEEAGKGNTVSDLGHTIFGQSFLDSKDHGGFLYIRPTFQCLQKLILPEPPYIFGILLQKWETPWAKVFPIRLMLRLGAEYRYYPCPLISVRFRNSAFMEIGHTIMNLLADFRSYQYMLPQIKGVTIHMEDKITYINFPRNRYDDVMKVIGNSNDHVMALGASFSGEADSHLVCIQNDEGNYQTQAINIQNKPRKVTGASFVVFNGALKASSGLSAKSSIVEDGLMVQIAPDAMIALKQSLRDMKDYTIGCGSVDAPQPEEVVMVQWAEDDKNVNVGVKSPIDQKSMDGVKSIRISNATDYVGDTRTIRWTEVFFIQEDSGTSRCDPVDLSRLAETLNQAACIALVPHLDKLKEANLTKIGLRITVDAEKVGYDIGANGNKLPSFYMNDLDNELIPVIHNAASSTHDSPITLELIFHILE